jgi:hypothetical protein
MRELTQEVELAVVEKVVGLLLQPQLLTQVWHVQQLQNNIFLLQASYSAARLPCQVVLQCYALVRCASDSFHSFLSESTELRCCTLCARTLYSFYLS